MYIVYKQQYFLRPWWGHHGMVLPLILKNWVKYVSAGKGKPLGYWNS